VGIIDATTRSVVCRGIWALLDGATSLTPAQQIVDVLSFFRIASVVTTDAIVFSFKARYRALYSEHRKIHFYRHSSPRAGVYLTYGRMGTRSKSGATKEILEIVSAFLSRVARKWRLRRENAESPEDFSVPNAQTETVR